MTFVSMCGKFYKKFRERVKIEGMIREDNGD